MMSLERMLPLLRCPRTKAKLKLENEYLISDSGEAYPIINGKPILVRNIKDMHITPPSARVISQNTGGIILGAEYNRPDMIVVNLGSGNVICNDERMISIDVLPNDNVDLVAEAEALPFKDGVIDSMMSGAVFEHLHDPLGAFREVKRVLIDGGNYQIDTAFMQSYHGFPGHYFNMTPQAIETFLVDDFIIERSGALGPPSAFYPIVTVFDFLAENLPKTDRDAFLSVPLGEALDQMRHAFPPAWNGRVTEFMMRTTAANYIVQARKPVGYDKRELEIKASFGEDAWASLKREYYAQKLALIREHHGVYYYKMLAVDDYGSPEDAISDIIPSLESLLSQIMIDDTLSISNWNSATTKAKEICYTLSQIRDKWTIEFMTRKQQTSVGLINKLSAVI